jgi:acetoin utilization deacetylase AcuC-like enzyme
MELLVYTHEACLAHDTGLGHPERPARIGAALKGIAASGVSVINREADMIDRELLRAVHAREYIDAIERFCAAGGGALDPDTPVVRASWEAALRSAGAGIQAVNDLTESKGDAAFVVTRPPGHHALVNRAMGFCLFNNIAVTARYLTEMGNRVAIIDWDVHHGNGTQDTFYEDPNVLYVSLHEFPAYPGTGWIDETGVGPGSGTNFNFAFPTGTGGGPYRWAFHAGIRPLLEEWAPDWLLVSAGYDAHRDDPLAGLELIDEDYRAMASMLSGVVDTCRTALFLEGGYNLTAIARSVADTVNGFDNPATPTIDIVEPSTAMRIARMTTGAIGNHFGLALDNSG